MLLAGAGAAVRPEGDDLLTVTGLTTDQVSELAFRHQVQLRELTARTGSLEDAFMKLTAASTDNPTEGNRVTTVTPARAGTAAEPPDRFRDILAAEWLKFRTLRSTRWSLAVSALVILALNAGTAYESYHYWHQNHVTPAGFIAQGIPLQEAFGTNAGVAMMILASAIGALTITGEYSTGLIRTTFTAVPARRPVMAAKASVITAVMTAYGIAVAALSFGLTQAILSGRHAGVSLSYPGALRVVVASALFAPLSALAGAAVGAIVRHSSAAVAASFVILLVLPLLIRDGSHLPAVIAHALPYDAWNRLVAVPYPPPGTAYPWTVIGAWIVFAAWALAAAVLTVTTVHRRDV
ncbi:MAG: transporter permease [Actinomycetia bacterium]|nr:transporter permease [Actinomycetes bacterium]